MCEDEITTIIKCMHDPIYFIENYIKIPNSEIGMTQFKLTNEQKDIIRDIEQNKINNFIHDRQIGMTSALMAYILWCTIFKFNYTIGIAAINNNMCTHNMSLYKTMYDTLPEWVKPKMIEQNKSALRFDNDNRIQMYHTIEDTYKFRGYTFNLFLIEHIDHYNKKCIDDFYNDVYPVLASSPQTKFITTANE